MAEDETQTISLTQVGTVIGTPAYISLEQAEGRPADARSDFFVRDGTLQKCSLDDVPSLAVPQPRTSVLRAAVSKVRPISFRRWRRPRPAVDPSAHHSSLISIFSRLNLGESDSYNFRHIEASVM